MTKYKIEDGTIVDVTEYSQESIDFFLTQYPEAELVQEEETQDFQNGAAEKDADVVPVATPSRASIISGVQPEDTDLELEDISSELQEPELKEFSERDLLVSSIEETEKQINDYIEQGGEVNKSDAAVLQGYKNDLFKMDQNIITGDDFSSDEFEKLESSEKIKLQEAASNEIERQYSFDGIVEFEITPEEIDNKAKKILKETTQPSLIESYAAQTVRGFASFVKNSVDFVDMVEFSIMEAGLNAFDSDYEGTPEEKKALMKVAKQSRGAVNFNHSLAAEIFIQKLEPSIREYENESIIDDIEEGNYLIAGERAVGSALESLPSVVAASLGIGGLVALGGSSAGAKFTEEFEKDPSINTANLVANALASGTIEAGFEIATRGVLKRAGILTNKGNRKAAEDLIRGGSESLIKKLGINTASEFGSEAATKTTSLLLDALPNYTGVGLSREFDLSKDWKSIAEEGLVGSVFGIAGTSVGAAKNRNVNAVKAAEYVLMPDEIKQVVINSSNELSELYKSKKTADVESSKLIDEAIKEEISKVVDIKSQNSNALKNMTSEEVKAYAKNKLEINSLNAKIKNPKTKEIVKNLAEQKLKQIKKVNKDLFRNSNERMFERRNKAASDLAKKLGFKKGPQVFNSTEDYIKAISENTNMSLEDAAIEARGSNGAFIGAGKIFVDKTVALKQGSVSVSNHEVLHPVLNAVLGDIQNQSRIVKEFKEKLNSSQLNWVQSQLDANVKTEDHDSEFLTYFSEGILNKDIKYDENVFTKLKKFVINLLKIQGYKNISFKSGEDVFEFLKQYNNSILKNDKVDSSVIEAIRNQETERGVKSSEIGTINDISLSKTNKEQVDALKEELDALDEFDFDDEFAFDAAKSNLENKIKTAERNEAKAKTESTKKPTVKKETSDKESKPKKVYNNENLIETIKSEDTSSKEKAVAEADLVDSFDTMALNAIKYDTRKGDYDRTEVRDYLRSFFPTILKSYNPSEAKFSTWVYNNIAPKAQQTYEKFKKIADKSLDAEAGTAGSVREAVADTSTTTEVATDKTSRKIKPIELVRNQESKNKYREAIKNIVESGEVSIDKSTFGNLKDLATEVTAEIFDIPVLKVTDPADNLTYKDVIVDDSNINKIKKYYPDAKVGMVIKSESSKIQDVIKSMGTDLFKLLPPENVSPELATVDAQAYKPVKGTGLKIPSSLMKVFYEATGKRSKGVTSQTAIKRLKPGLTYEQFLKDLGIVKGQPNTYDRAIGQRLKAITTLFGKLATNTEVRQLELVTDVQKQNIEAGKSDIQFSKSSKDLLNKFNLNYTEIRSKLDVDDYIENMVKPLINVFNSEDYKLLNRTVLQFRSKSLGGNKIVSDYLRNKLSKLNLPKRVTVGRTKPSSAIGNTVEKFEKSLKSGKINKYNKRNSEVFDKMWNDINDIVSKDRNMAVPIMYFLENSINEATNPHRMGAPIIGYQVNAGKLYYEHAVQSQLSYLSLMESILDPDKNFKSEFEKIKENYKIIAISESSNDKLNKAGYALKMPKDWKNWYDRYFNKKVASIDGGINPNELINIKGGTFADDFGINNKGGKISKEKIALNKSIIQASKSNNNMLPKSQKLKGDFTNDQVLDKMRELDSKQREAQISFSKTFNLDKDFNDILENKTGIAAEKTYGKVKAEVVGASKGKFDFFIAPSAEDFVGLLYKTLGKGKKGDAQMAWYKTHLLDPFARAMNNVSADRNSLGRDFKALKKDLKIVPKDLKKRLPGEYFTKEQAIRVYIWEQTGADIPGLSEADQKTLVDIVKDNTNLVLFANEIMKLNKGIAFAKPSENWVSGTITTDLIEGLNSVKRKQYLELWQQNVDIIFSEKNLNKLEAAYGKSYRYSLEGTLERMKTGRNRTFGTDSLTGRFLDWINGTTGAIMFFNTRSAVLQTISAANFINFQDNNVFAASKAFANQKQYWSDFKMLFNSDFLVERRDGLKLNVQESDIADIAKERGARGVIGRILKLGFTPTQLADSFAIAAGGSTFYRNRLNKLIKEGMDPLAAKKQAMRDFRETAEESQQSSRPDKISQQQAGPLGRTVLAFANTPAQYARLMKKAASDIKNGRGDFKTNVSKIMYYGFVQNLIFNTLTNALFAIEFGEDEEEESKKYVSVANGMADSVLRGIGVSGAIVSVLKNAALTFVREDKKKNPNYEKITDDILRISPPIASKISKIKSASRSYKWDKKEMGEKGFSLDNPAYLAGANVVSAATNLPLDRVIKKMDHIRAASNSELETYKRIFLLAGWSKWDLGIKEPKKPKKSKKKNGNFGGGGGFSSGGKF